MKILVTGAAGFIGAALTERLLQRGDRVVGVDSLNDYYDVALKHARLDRLRPHADFEFVHGDITDREGMAALFRRAAPERVVHLAAQAGVRYSLDHPHAYVDANLVGFMNILEGCRHGGIGHLVFASSSSVYGANARMPFSVDDRTDQPVSLYGATKKANELMAHAYSHLYRLPATGLRFFTVYGPWGRPDMSLFLFTQRILAGQPIDVFNGGRHERDFTYIDDVIEGVVRVLDVPAAPDTGAAAPCRVYNIGRGQPVNLLRYIELIEERLGRKAVKNMLPLQPGDVPATGADVSALEERFGYAPSTPIEVGVARFVDWYLDYYGVR